MGNERRMSTATPDVLTAADIAKSLGCSEWWVKEQARRRRVPFLMIGGSYRFTREHLDEIIRFFEFRPVPEAGPALATSAHRPRRSVTPNPVGMRLKARQPKRARQCASSSDAA